MKSLLDGISSAQVVDQPFPHLVVDDAFDAATAGTLLEEYPSIALMKESGRGAPLDIEERPNKKICYYAHDAEQNTAFSPLWREFVRAHFSFDFLRQFTETFRPSIDRHVPHLWPFLDGLEPSDIGLFFDEDASRKKILIDGGICVDTPAHSAHDYAIHLDNAHRIGNLLYYLRPADDAVTGGDLILYRPKGTRIEITPKAVVKSSSLPALEPMASIGYRHNRALFFLNTNEAFHAVMPRVGAKHLRYAVVLGFNVNYDLHDYSHFAEPWFTRKWNALRFRLGAKK